MADVKWTGLDELKLLLISLPEHLTGEATSIVNAAADGMLADVAAAYPTGPSGNLKRGLKRIEVDLGRHGVGIDVKNTAKHAWLFEHGTEARHTSTGADRGAMFGGRKRPPGNVFIPAAQRHRRAMYHQLRAMLEREGLFVSGDV